MLSEFNQTAAGVRRCCLHELVISQTERMPQAVALEWNGAKLSYRELGERTTIASRLLLTRGGFRNADASGHRRPPRRDVR